jgi:sigma-B regulation protein RsbU (phosphoserine phosphatase)
MPEARYEEQSVELVSGNLLLFYSDGLTEAQNTGGEFFGEQRLFDLLARITGLSAERMGERLVAEVERFVGEAKMHDDLSIIVMKKE